MLRSGLHHLLKIRKVSKQWADSRFEEIDKGDGASLVEVAQDIRNNLPVAEYRRWFEESVGVLAAEDRSVILAIARLNAPIATTNYDNLIEDVTQLRTVTWRDPYLFSPPPGDFSLGDQRRVAVRTWNEDNSTRQAVSVDLPFAADLQRADLIARLQAEREDYDVLGLDVVWTAEFAEGRHIEPLEPYKAGLQVGRFVTPALESATFGGALWGMPLFSNAGLLYYRTDLVKRIPSTWAELAKQATTLGRKHEIAGYVGQLARYEGLTVNLVEAIWGQGGDLLLPQPSDRPPDKPPQLDVDATARGLAFLRDGIHDGWIPATTRAHDEEQSRLAFQSGQAVFMRNWPYAYDLLAAQDSPVRKVFDVAPLPGPSALGGANLAISRFSRQQKTALEFIRFLTPFYGQVPRVIQEAAFSVLGLGEEPVRAAQRLAERLPAALEGR